MQEEDFPRLALASPAGLLSTLGLGGQEEATHSSSEGRWQDLGLSFGSEEEGSCGNCRMSLKTRPVSPGFAERCAAQGGQHHHGSWGIFLHFLSFILHFTKAVLPAQSMKGMHLKHPAFSLQLQAEPDSCTSCTKYLPMCSSSPHGIFHTLTVLTEAGALTLPAGTQADRQKSSAGARLTLGKHPALCLQAGGCLRT